MRFELEGRIVLSGDATAAKDAVAAAVQEANDTVLAKGPGGSSESALVTRHAVTGNEVAVALRSEGRVRAHDALLRLRKLLAERLGKAHRLGVRDVVIDEYRITFTLDKPLVHAFSVPYAHAIRFDGNECTLELRDVSKEVVENNYIDRMIKLVRDKVGAQHYEGKGEYHRTLWAAPEKAPVWDRDPTEAMLEKEWLKQGPTKGKWVFRAPMAAILRAMERIAVEEVLEPLGFQEIMIPHHEPFEVTLKTGHIHGVPNEVYYVSEPRTRDAKEWEHFVDLVKVTKQVPTAELLKNLSTPNATISYAQCPNIYWSYQGKTLADASLPVRVFDRAVVSNRYESGGRHGIERVDEFHRIEPVYIGTREQLLDLREKMIERYKHVFNEVLDLEWRMAWVTPFFMAQEGRVGLAEAEDKPHELGTIDFEAWMPYRGTRDGSEWLEFQNLSIVGDKYTGAFNIKSQREDLWSGCSGIGLERWSVAFLAQKGLDPANWPSGFRKYLPKLPEPPQFM